MSSVSVAEKVKTVTPPVVQEETEELSPEKEVPVLESMRTARAASGGDMPGNNGTLMGNANEKSSLSTFNINKLPILTDAMLLVQPKLTINRPGDVYEQEADAIAEKVMQMNEPVNEPEGTVLDDSSPVQQFTEKATRSAEMQETEEEMKEENTEDEMGPAIGRLQSAFGGDDDNRISRKETGPGVEVQSSAVQQILNKSGIPLEQKLRKKMERRFGFDFSQVRIHNDAEAHSSAKAINAAAYTYRNNIVFGSGYYQPSSREGQKLLAHELTHVVQQYGTYLTRLQANGALVPTIKRQLSTELVQRELDLTLKDNEVLLNPINGTVTASIFIGLQFSPADPAQPYAEGAHKYIQGMSAMIKGLAGTMYSPDLVKEFIESLGGESGLTHIGGTGNIAGPGEKIDFYFLTGSLPGLLIQFFDKKKIPFPADLREILQSYYDADRLFEDMSLVTPKWFTRDMLAGLVLSKKTWLTKYADLAAKEKRDEDTGTEYSADYYGKLEQYVFFYIDIVEAIRKDKALLTEPAYSMLWDLPFNLPDAKIKVTPAMAGGDYIDIVNVMRLFQQCDTDIADAKKATGANEAGHLARAKLLKDAMSIPLNGQTAKANTKLSDRLNRYNAPAFPATLRSYPPLEPPLFELVSNTSPTFSMSVEWGSFYDALGFAFAGSYGFELIRISDSVIANLIQLKEGKITDEISAKAQEEMKQVAKVGQDNTIRGEQPNVGDVIGQKIDKRLDYLAEDVETVFDGMGKKYGPEVGMAILGMDAVGNAFGAVGDVISSFWEDINADRWEKKIPINKPGLYIVRATAFQRDIPESATYVHAPSVAWMPVWARSAKDYSSKYLDVILAGRENAKSQLEDLKKQLLPGVTLSEEERKAINDKIEVINTALTGTVEKQLEARLKKVEDALASNPDKDIKEMLEREKTEVKRLLAIQRTRTSENKVDDQGLEAPFTLPAIFISDNGPATRLYLELIEQPKTNGKYSFFVSDLTSSKMSSHTGPVSDSRDDAIQSAILEYLMQPNRYGRGYCSISIPPPSGVQADPVKKTIRVKSDEAVIVLDSIENITSALTVILIAAAPFTAGASLAILLPVGIVGAIPSAYRLYDRTKGDSFYLDWSTAMDIVNVVSAFAGIGGKAASGLKLITVGKGFAIVGFGLDGLGVIVGTAKTMEDIDLISKRSDLSPGAKRAMIMSSIGGQLASIGLTVGTRVYETGKLMEKAAIEESNAASKKPPIQDNVPPIKEQGTPPAAKSNDTGSNTTDNTPVQKPPVVNEPDLQTPKTTSPETTGDNLPAKDTPAKTPGVSDEPELQTPKTTAPDTTGDNVPAKDTPAKTPGVTDEPELQTPKKTAPDTTVDNVPAKDTPSKTPAVTNEPETQTPAVKPPVGGDDPVKQTPEKTPAAPVAEETEIKKPSGETEEGGDATKKTPDAAAPIEEKPIDKKIATAEAELDAAKQKQREIAARMQELNKIVTEEMELRKELLDRHAKSTDPAEKQALLEKAKESKGRQEKAVQEYNELFDESGALSTEVRDLEKKLAGLKDIKSERVQDDIDVDPKPPKANDGAGKIGTTPNQNTQLLADVLEAKAKNATDIRVNQQQVDASGKRVGTNRPDLQYTLNGQRYYIEYEHMSNPRGDEHTKRTLANDQNGIVQVKLVPDTPGFKPGKGVVILTKP
ncbi:MAG: DUF4157 domain-containing protein [Bacteroidetes bacterium]|nr:DUF4157 domain-containing protein [Bacteroidota bacterium]